MATYPDSPIGRAMETLDARKLAYINGATGVELDAGSGHSVIGANTEAARLIYGDLIDINEIDGWRNAIVVLTNAAVAVGAPPHVLVIGWFLDGLACGRLVERELAAEGQ